ncbi:FkbM family methyltransferase [Hyphomicrobiales bacterium]|nr:FkbM family methyltransferase [Hyphomicrobiales bacterium]
MNIDLSKFSFSECIHGQMVWPINDNVLGICLKYYGEWSEGENIIMSQFISEGDIVVDIGANIGTTVLSLSKQVKETGRVIAFEPQSLMAQCLQTNLTINNVTNVCVYTSAVSDKNGWAFINDTDFSDLGRYGEAGISENGTRVSTLKLDEVEVSKCNLVKVDVESHEWEVIQGGKVFLKKHKPVIFIEAKKEVDGTKKYLKWLFENGWRCYWHYAFWYRQENYKKNNDITPLKDVGLGVGDMNVVAVPFERDQPKNLLELRTFDELWTQEDLKNFYELKKIQWV